MTKKDYELIASVLKDNALGQISDSHRVVNNADTMLYNITQGLCDALASKNPRFNKDKFLQACGVDNWFYELQKDYEASGKKIVLK